MSSRRRLLKLLDQQLKSHYKEWEENLDWGSSKTPEFFADWEHRNYPLFLDNDFCPNEAWWLAELCHLAYTPDSKEFSRIWNARKTDRLDILEQRTPFRELLNIHKTSNSASIYEMGNEGTVVCFRGSIKLLQWLTNLVFHPHEWERYRDEDEAEGAYIHSGFYVGFKRIWPKLWPTLRLAPKPWIFTGHSLGGALAMLAHAAIKADKVYTFGAPRVGNYQFVNLYLDRTFRVVNNQDIVPLLPAKDKSMGDKEFAHGGELVWLDAIGEMANADELEAHLNRQPWDILEEWAKSETEEIFRHRPVWVKDHSMVHYCNKLAKMI